MKRSFAVRFLIYASLFASTAYILTKAYETYLYFGRPIPVGSRPLFTLHRENRTRAELVRLKNLPLKTKGRNVVDQRGGRFKMASVNWYGGSDELFIPSGLDIRHRSEIAKVIKELGFNSVRLPYSDEMVRESPLIGRDLLLKNQDLVGGRALDIFQAVVEAMTDEGIAVVPNNHITQATWCCGINPCDASWHNDYLGSACRVQQTEEQWIENWETVMERFVNNSLVVGADLRNEVRGVWGTMPWSSWAAAAEKAGNRLLALNPDWLIFVEGTSSSNDLAGVRERPVVLDVDDRLVYSAHVYGWSGWAPWEDPTHDALISRSQPRCTRTGDTSWKKKSRPSGSAK
ncbi:hypothetical protein G7Y89_g14309 [Cudoniella acicularis]|uniref:Glycoside hydrolase family 5 domain-containing protein n=1 Tax=Cudoniella acicularis TaxID=354080 RepID=A0A8H4R5T5_9HELO|nr:hypothetical protein G7Y89_g14309 [Cudoniella acicularis]